ncbi:MAG: ImmA/IrrE family metallo-endopeptidase [Lachnospiraceae bacterium]|nr:ImmA/IrrE family metallo-endopeptidase [Lachnospiraceae bacterium]
MDYMTRPLSRIAVRRLSKQVRTIFGLNESEPFPVLDILEKICIIFKDTDFIVVEDNELPSDVFAWCYQRPECGFVIEIKRTVYDGACYNKNRAFLSFICHEICHVILFYIGYTPVSTRTMSKSDSIPAYCSIEWQAKALCGELMIPYEATIGMEVNEIVKKYWVTEASAMYRVKQD